MTKTETITCVLCWEFLHIYLGFHDKTRLKSENKQEKHHVWVQTARLNLHLICIISNKYQNSGIFSKNKRKPEKVAKHT